MFVVTQRGIEECVAEIGNATGRVISWHDRINGSGYLTYFKRIWGSMTWRNSPDGIQLQNSQHSRSVSATPSRFKQEHIAPRRLEAARDLLWHGTQRNFAAPLDTTSPCHVSRSYQVSDRLDYQTLQSIPRHPRHPTHPRHPRHPRHPTPGGMKSGAIRVRTLMFT